MKITKRRLRALINEAMVSDSPGGPFEFTKPEEDPQAETMLNSPRYAGRMWAYKNLADAVDSALGSGLSNDDIRDAIEKELGPVEGEADPMIRREGQMSEVWLQILGDCLDETRNLT